MKLQAEQLAGGLVIRAQGSRIDAGGAIAFKDAMRALTEGSEGRVILDLGEVDFVDSSGLGAIVAAMKQLGTGRKLELSGLTPTVDRVFRLTRMDRVFPIHASVADALPALRQAS